MYFLLFLPLPFPLIILFALPLPFPFLLYVPTAKTWSYYVFQYQQYKLYSGRREASFELSNYAICPPVSLLW